VALSSFKSEISVLILFNLDPDWPARERADVYTLTSQFCRAIEEAGYRAELVPVIESDLGGILSGFDPLKHIVFNWCEGLPGVHHSEWLVAEYLERHDFTFTGASASTLALAQDKPRIKTLLDSSGIRTPGWRLYHDVSNVRWRRFPAIVKPSREHCSEGIDRNAVVTGDEALKNRVRYIIEEYRQPALVEDFIDGRELHVSLWGDGTINMLPPAEMEFSLFDDEQDRLCTYESKFVPESAQYNNIKTVLPAHLDAEELDNVESLCRAAYLAAGCRDYARIDMRIKDGLYYILDINPNCDICPDTSTISAAELAGYDYGEFGDNIVRLAGRRHPVWGEPGCFRETSEVSN
jgi:D-alanine-D-alanine ligase